MQMTPEGIFEAALNLSECDRLDLAHRLLDTMPPGPDLLSVDDPNLIEELDRRAVDDSGSVLWSDLKNE